MLVPFVVFGHFSRRPPMSPTKPPAFTGRRLLEGESHILRMHTVVVVTEPEQGANIRCCITEQDNATLVTRSLRVACPLSYVPLIHNELLYSTLGIITSPLSCLAEKRVRRTRNRIAPVVLGDYGVSSRRKDEELRDRSNRHRCSLLTLLFLLLLSRVPSSNSEKEKRVHQSSKFFSLVYTDFASYTLDVAPSLDLRWKRTYMSGGRTTYAPCL